MTQVSRDTGNNVTSYDSARPDQGSAIVRPQGPAPVQPPKDLSPIAMASLIATIRRPPLLRTHTAASKAPHRHDQILQKHAATLAKYSSSELAFFASHMVHRREADIRPVQASGVRDGYVALAKLAKMYQHLSILQK